MEESERRDSEETIRNGQKQRSEVEREKEKSSATFHCLELTRRSYSKYHCKKAIKHLGENMKVTLPPYR